MPKEVQSTAARGRAKASIGPHSSFESLRKASANTVEQHRHSTKTRASYDGYVARGQAFLKVYCKGSTSLDSASPSSTSQGIPSGDYDDDDATSWNDPLFVKALDKIPNKYSPEALDLFITSKCINEGCKKSTAESICASFKKFWDESDKGGLYNKDSEWEFDEIRKRWRGNPVNAPRVQNLVKSIRNMYAKDGERNHSLAMTYDHLEKIQTWSEEQCPTSSVDACMEDRDMEERMLRTKHLMRSAFFSTAFVLWTRNEELASLKFRSITFGCEGPAPYQEPCFRVHLEHRKGWQRNLDKTQHSASRHVDDRGIYDQPQKPAMNAFIHLPRWIKYLETNHYCRKMQPDDYVFPSFGCNGIFKPKEHVSHEAVQNMIDSAVDAAGIPRPSGGSYSTHCFRRGGAQYRFMFAPPTERWTLARIKWWGGWSDNEPRDTLIRYLLDELRFVEESHADALCTTAPAYQVSLLSQHSENELVTKGEFRVMFGAMNNSLNHVQKDIADLAGCVKTVANTSTANLHLSQLSAALPAALPVTPPVTLSLPPHLNYSPAAHDAQYMPYGIPSNQWQYAYSQPPPLLPTLGSVSNVHGTASWRTGLTVSGWTPPDGMENQEIAFPYYGFQAGPCHAGVARPVLNSHVVGSGPLTHDIINHVVSKSVSNTLPPPGLSIPDIRPKNPMDALELVLAQWRQANPDQGLILALKDWPTSWYSGANKDKFGMKRFSRQVIALEYIDNFGEDDAAFKSEYPEWRKGFTALKRAVNAKRKQRGDQVSRNRQRLG